MAGVSIVALLNSSFALSPENLSIPEFIIIQGNAIKAVSQLPELSEITLKTDWLSFCESSDNPDLIVWDNGSYSYGRFMYKFPTFKSYAVEYGYLPSDLEREDYINWALDGEFAYKLTERIIREGGEGNWLNCIKKFKNSPQYYSWIKSRE